MTDRAPDGPGTAERRLGDGSSQPAAGNGAELALGAPKAEAAIGDSSSSQPAAGNGAELALGAPRRNRGWYSRGYLPHCDHPGLLQFITYHLADSLPAEVRERLKEEVRHAPREQREAEWRKRAQAWLDAGHGSCILRRPEAAACVLENWQRFAGERYDLIAWVVMPNHVHVLVRVYEGVPLAKIVQSWKSYTGAKLRPLLDAAWQGQGRRPEGVWYREYWDRYIRDERHFLATIAYIHDNPVKARLVAQPEDWPWSSARGLGPGSAER